MDLLNHLEKLNYFYQTAEAGSIKKAAEVIHISQPSLTRAIKVLEEVIGEELFVRSHLGVNLTQRGQILYDYCKGLFHSLNDLTIRLDSPEDIYSGSLRIGTYDSIAIYFWPKFLKNFFKKFPNIRLSLTTGRSVEIQDKLLKNELDLILIVNPKSDENIRTINLYSDKFQLYKSEKLQKNSINNQTPIIYMLTNEISESAIRQLTGLDENPMFSTSSIEAVKELVLSGVGIGFLPIRVAKDLADSKKLSPFKVRGKNLSFGSHTIGLAYHQNGEDSKTLQKFVFEIKHSDLI